MLSEMDRGEAGAPRAEAAIGRAMGPNWQAPKLADLVRRVEGRAAALETLLAHVAPGQSVQLCAQAPSLTLTKQSLRDQAVSPRDPHGENTAP